MSESPLLAWHFLPADRRLRFGDRTLVEPGQTLTVEPPLELCTRGLHASVRPIDALFYAPGPILCRVALSGEIIHDGDKVCAQHRTVLWMADATRTLHLFACDEAERALRATEIDDSRCFDAIATKRRWIDGKATGEELAAARAAASAAARAAASAAASAAAWAAARAAARAAAWAAASAAASAAAWAAASAAAWAAARAAAREAQNERLTAAFFGLQPKEAE